MPKCTLEFQLPEESEEFKIAMDAGKYVSFVEDFEMALRNMYKYDVHPTQSRQLTDEEHNLVDEIRTIFFNLKSDL